MGRQYSARTFLRATPNELLRAYFQQLGVQLGLNWSMLDESNVNPLFVAIEQLPAAVRSQIDGDFAAISEMACEAGVLAILEKAGGRARGLAERFAGMKNAYERVFWTFLNEPDVFRLAGCFHEMDRRAGWRRRFVGAEFEPRTDDASLRAFEKALQLLYRRQGRGRFCHVDYYRRDNPLRHCFFAYPEDYASTDNGFDDHGRFQQRARRSALELIFVYRPDDGILELLAHGRAKDVEVLEQAFGREILGLGELPDQHAHVPFDLTILKRPDFDFPTDPRDHVVGVDVQTPRLELPLVRSKGARRRILVTAASTPQAPHALHRLLNEAINADHVPLDDVVVSQAKLRLTFEPPGDRRRRTLTFDVTYPDRCTLKDAPYDHIARKYLEEWGIACA